jgi:hypothetical protein
MFIIECRKCGLYFDADTPDRNICLVCLRDAEQEAMIADLNKCNQAERTAEMSTSITERLPFCPP